MTISWQPFPLEPALETDKYLLHFPACNEACVEAGYCQELIEARRTEYPSASQHITIRIDILLVEPRVRPFRTLTTTTRSGVDMFYWINGRVLRVYPGFDPGRRIKLISNPTFRALVTLSILLVVPGTSSHGSMRK